MKKNTLVLILLALLAATLSACDSATSAMDVSLQSSSSMESSSSDSILSASSAEEWRSSVIQIYLSSKGVSNSITQSSSSSSVYNYYYGEMGDVCDKWDIQNVTGNSNHIAYTTMRKACGDQVTSSTGKNFGVVVYRWVLETAYPDYMDDARVVNGEVREKGSSFHLFDDGHKYFYIEPIGDGEGNY
jgi:hypothetical protein